MYTVLCLMMLSSSCLAHYGDSYYRNFIHRAEPDVDAKVVECPVCEEKDWMVNNEHCDMEMGNKKYKRCKLGTYVNRVCGGRLDCYRGPGEECTEKQVFDTYGKKCAPGYFCNRALGVCTGIGYEVDSVDLWRLTHYPYAVSTQDSLKNQNEDIYKYQ